MVHIPIARQLIAKYSGETWKEQINHPDFVMREFQICHWLHNRINRPRDKVIELVAASLGVNRILLHNDPDLPF